LSSNISTKTNKVPFLGDLPFIGKLFQHKSEVVNNTDLIIEITPRIVNLNEAEVELEIDPRLERRLLTPNDKEE
jgi:type II secretory pathway component GspD/PulD (secretin)